MQKDCFSQVSELPRMRRPQIGREQKFDKQDVHENSLKNNKWQANKIFNQTGFDDIIHRDT